MQFTRVQPRKRPPDRDPRVHASLDELVRLQFKSSGFSFLPRQPVHSILSGRHASRLRGRGLNFEELRGYLPGDDIRSLDWKVTARTREPYVRVYTEERDRPVWLVVDQRAPMFFGSRRLMKSVTAAEATAVAAWRVLSQGDRVGAVVFGESGLDIVPPHRSKERVMQILKQVVRHNHALPANQAEAGSRDLLNQALQKLQPLARHDCLVTLVTDGYGADDETARQLSLLSQHNDVLIAFIFDQLERELPDAGRLTFASGQQRLELNTSGKRLRSDWTEDFEQRLQNMQAVSRRYSVPLLPLDTERPVLEQIRDLLGQHQATRRVR